MLLKPSLVEAASGSAADAIKSLETVVKPAIQKSTDWATKVALAIVSMNAFYYAILKLLD